MEGTQVRTARTREGDGGVLCWLALRAGQFWDFIDSRDIDKHAMAWATFFVTIYILKWSLDFVWIYPDKSGLETAAMIAAANGTWTPVQAVVVKWYFESRTQSQEKA